MFNYVNTLKRRLESKHPDLLSKLESSGVNEFLWFTKWFQTLFTYHFDLFYSVRLWDVFLVKGLDVIIDISIFLIEKIKPKIENLEEIDEIVKEIESVYSLNEGGIQLINSIKSRFEAA